MSVPEWAVRIVPAGLGLGAWFWTQALIGRRTSPAARIEDRILDLTSPVNRYLAGHPRWADGLLIATSALIDALGLFLVARSIFGPTIRPLVGLLLLFALRQICQGVCSLPAPEGMIWRHPGVPSLLVTYGTSSDLFFSGHTAIAVYGCLELAHWGGLVFGVMGAIVALGEVTAVLVLRAHYTMDVFAGVITALWVWAVGAALAPHLDAVLSTFAH